VDLRIASRCSWDATGRQHTQKVTLAEPADIGHSNSSNDFENTTDGNLMFHLIRDLYYISRRHGLLARHCECDRPSRSLVELQRVARHLHLSRLGRGCGEPSEAASMGPAASAVHAQNAKRKACGKTANNEKGCGRKQRDGRRGRRPGRCKRKFGGREVIDVRAAWTAWRWQRADCEKRRGYNRRDVRSNCWAQSGIAHGSLPDRDADFY
jgi:hypothetical protein